MFFIWGSGSGSTSEGKVKNITKCEKCNNNIQYIGSIHYKYFHFWYIFSFLFSKKYYFICEQCNEVHQVSKKTFKNDFEKNHIPFIRKFGWLVCIVIFIIFALSANYSGNLHRNEIQSYLEAPISNDIYLADLTKIKDSGYKEKKGHLYGAIKLIKPLENNNYSFVISTKAYNKKKGIEQDYRENNIKYATDEGEELILSNEEILKLKKIGVIYDVIRVDNKK